MKIFKLSMRFFVCQFVLAILSVILVLPMFKLASEKPYVFSLITAVIYFISMYSASWRAGRSDSRKIPGYYPDKKLPLWLSLTTAIVPVILYIIWLAFPDIWKINLPFMDGSYDFFVSGCRVYGTPDMLYRLWYFPFAAFISNNNPLCYLLPMPVLPVLIFFGYNVGLTRFSVTEYLYLKLVFTKDGGKKENRLRR